MADRQGIHPTPRDYVEVGVVLAALTGAEVALYFAPLARVVTIPSLLALTAVKFSLVVLWYMHLRFDIAVFRRLFAMGGFLAVAVYAAVLLMFLFSPLGQAQASL